jgi:hypothetical protein
MEREFYQLYGIDTAMHLLRPGAKWEISNTMFTRWDDPRPCPTIEEVFEVMEKIKAFESTIDTVFTEAQLKELRGQHDMISRAVTA